MTTKFASLIVLYGGVFFAGLVRLVNLGFLRGIPGSMDVINEMRIVFGDYFSGWTIVKRLCRLFVG